MKVKEFYSVVKLHDETWKFLQETNAQKLTYHPETVAQTMLFSKLKESDSNDRLETETVQ